MSGFTITGGVSFSGAVSMSDAPAGAPENTAAWFGGGFDGPIYSTVDRITFATDTATASARGPLSVNRRDLAAASNSDYGWFAAGVATSSSPVTYLSSVDRITYATDTATASVRGPLSAGRISLAAAGNTTDGWFGGGSFPGVSKVDRITYATDTATASVRGPLSSVRYSLAAAGNSDYAWFGGGYGGGAPGPQSRVDRITYATDTATASVRGPLSTSRSGLAAAGNTTDGWFGGGYLNAGYDPGSVATRSTVQRITYATDTDTATVRGPLSLARRNMAAAGNTTDGWFGGGFSPGYTHVSTVQRITYATDTATASVRGPLSSGKSLISAAAGIQ